MANAEWCKTYYEKNKADYARRNTENRLKIRLHMQVEKARPCADCGVQYPYYVMQFDHRPGEKKLYQPATLPNVGSWPKMLVELAKCDVVCANCHAQRTYERAASAEGCL